MLDLSCRDWEARIKAGRSLVPDLKFSAAQQAEADLAVGFFDALRLPDVPGTPLLRDAAGDWFRDLVRAVFGARDPATNARLIREYLMMVGKGNSKTTYGAALMLVAMLMNQRPRAEMLFVADTQAISDLAFSAASGMIEADDQLRRRFKASEHHKVIRDLLNGSKLRVKTFDLNVLTGPKPVAVLLDELHLLGKKAHAAKVMRQIRGGLEKMTEGFLVMITTQSDERPGGVFKDELFMARNIRDGKFPGRMLPLLYELPEAVARDRDQWSKPENWPMVMPNLGRSLQLNSLIADFDSEKQKGDNQVLIWASQHLNIQIGAGGKTDAWPGADPWARQEDPGLTFETMLDRCECIVVGIDGGGLDDLFGLTLIGREIDTKRWLVWSHSWCHTSVLDRRKSIAQVLIEAKEAGELTIVDDELDDVSQIIDRIKVVKDHGLLGSVWVDPAGLGEFTDALADPEIDITVENKLLHGAAQGYGMMNALKTCERKLTNGTMVHAPSGLLAWCISNIKIEPTATAIRATKQNAGDAKIDPAMAMFDAAQGMMLNPEAAISVYETRGPRFA